MKINREYVVMVDDYKFEIERKGFEDFKAKCSVEITLNTGEKVKSEITKFFTQNGGYKNVLRLDMREHLKNVIVSADEL
jgi:hypothetical protein